MLISGKISIAIRETAPAASRQTKRMPAVTVKGRFNENSARDIVQPARRVAKEAGAGSRGGLLLSGMRSLGSFLLPVALAVRACACRQVASLVDDAPARYVSVLRAKIDPAARRGATW